MNNMNIYEILKKLKINYNEIEHKKLYTIEDAINAKITNKIKGQECKNLFLKSKNNYYILLLPARKKADLKTLKNLLNVSNISFANEAELHEILGLEKGSVTPLGIINDIKNLVTILIDKELEYTTILIHPNTNNKTISIKYEDLIKFINYLSHNFILISENN